MFWNETTQLRAGNYSFSRAKDVDVSFKTKTKGPIQSSLSETAMYRMKQLLGRRFSFKIELRNKARTDTKFAHIPHS